MYRETENEIQITIIDITDVMLPKERAVLSWAVISMSVSRLKDPI